MMFGTFFTIFLLFASHVSFAEDIDVDLSTPEKTIETYYKGYMTGNKEVIQSTHIGLREISPLGLNAEITYRILEKKLFLYTTDYIKPGDIEVKVSAEWKDKNSSAKGRQPETLLTTFILRRYGQQWKIVAGYAVPPNPVGD